MNAPAYNFAYLDEQTKRMIRRAILKAIAIPGYQVPFASREMPMPYGWGTGGVQVTAAILGPEDVLKVIDQGSDDTTNAISIRQFFGHDAKFYDLLEVFDRGRVAIVMDSDKFLGLITRTDLLSYLRLNMPKSAAPREREYN